MAIVSECTGHTCHSQHHVLWHFFRQSTTTVLLVFTYEFDIQEKACFSWSWGEVQSSGSICQRAPAISEYGHQPNSPARLSSLQSERAQHHCVTIVCTLFLPPGPTRRSVCPPRGLMPVGVAAFSFSRTVHRCCESDPHRNLAASVLLVIRHNRSPGVSRCQFTGLLRVGHVVFGGTVVQVVTVVEGCRDAGVGSDPHRRGRGVQLRLSPASQIQCRFRSQ